MEALGRLVPSARNMSTVALGNFSAVAPGQLGVTEAQLPPQPTDTIGNTSLSITGLDHLPWPKALAAEIANRYMTAAFCSWYSTGGSIDGILSQLPLSDLNATGTYTGDSGHMFEKFNVTDPDAAGGGGEYTVVTGFGWTNGVVLWAAGAYGQLLPKPTCPLILITENGNSTASVSVEPPPSTQNTPAGTADASASTADSSATTPDASAPTASTSGPAKRTLYVGARRRST